MYAFFIKPIFFALSPERAHHVAMRLLQITLAFPLVGGWLRRRYRVPDQPVTAVGLTFRNPVGLAAGFDKDGKYITALAALGFGSIEVGTVTPRAQAGNPRPRLFRLPKDRALINRMGFNNDGVDALVGRLRSFRQQYPQTPLIIGGNIGKNKDTPNERATDDYMHCFEALFPYVDYFVVNVSSPNTPNLRALQDKEPLQALLAALQQRNREQPAAKPILLKIAPDLTPSQLDDIIAIVQTTGIAGIVATNTTIVRATTLQTTSPTLAAIGNGGLSGAPLTERATEVIAYLHQHAPTLPIIGVGGIHDGSTAQQKLRAGATLLQVYTGFIYEGPGIVRNILRDISA